MIRSATESKIQQMLTENTGVHLLDSGDAYGRNWERNRAIDISEKDPVIIDEVIPDNQEVIVSVSTYHFLKEHLQYTDWAERETEEFHQFCKDRSESPQMHMMKKYTGLRVINTFDMDPPGGVLDQILQFIIYDPPLGFGDGLAEDMCRIPVDRSWILLQIHGGCDVRGGYTDAVVFEIESGGSEFILFNLPVITVECECGVAWSSYDGGRTMEPRYSVSMPHDWEDVILCEDEKEIYCANCGSAMQVSGAGLGSGEDE